MATSGSTREADIPAEAASRKPFPELVRDELARARGKHAGYASAHEAYAVILEELDEFWDQVKRKRAERDRAAMLAELVQVATTAWLAAEDLGLVGKLPERTPHEAGEDDPDIHGY